MSALVGRSFKSLIVSYIDQQVVTRNVMLGYHRHVPAATGDWEYCAPAQPRERAMLNRSTPSFFHGKATSERPFCADCDAPMILSLLEQDILADKISLPFCMLNAEKT